MYFLYLLFSLTLSVTHASHAPTVGLRLSFEPATLDWNLGDVPIHVINNVVEGLYRIDEAGALVPCEADGPPMKIARVKSPGLWRIRLREGLRWSDGRPLHAQDYVDSWRRLLRPETASAYAYLLFALNGAREFNAGKAGELTAVTAKNSRELEVQLADPNARSFPTAVLTHWATFPIRADLAATPDWGLKPEHMVFNGPYLIASYQPGTRLELVPNRHHRSPGRLSRIEALIVQDDSTALRLYESGRLHFVADLGTLDRSALARRPDFRTRRSPVLVYLGINPRDAVLGTPGARRALGAAIDREALVAVVAGAGTATSSLAPDGTAPTAAMPQPRKDPPPALSGQKLDFGYFEKGVNRTVAELAQARWKAVLNLTVELRPSEVKSYWKLLAQRPYPIFLNTYGPPVWDNTYYFELLTSAHPMNMGRWSNPEFDRAVHAADLKAAARILDREQPIVPLYYRAYDYLLSPRLKHATLNPMTSLYLDAAELEADSSR